MIHIKAPYIQAEETRTVLCTQITLGGKEQTAWLATEPEYGSFLVDDRLDAFVVGFLTTAMRQGEDIVCDAPLSRRLHYQLTQYLIPTMAANIDIYHPISIHAPLTDAPLPCENAVATGWTGGVDSMYTLMTHSHTAPSSCKLTHLLIANVGTLESENNTELLQLMAEKARNDIAAEQGLSVVSVDSNLQILQQENYLAVAAFRLPAAVLALQKLFGVFLNSAGYEFERFSFNPENSAYYELFVFNNLATENTMFYSAGGQMSRMEKLDALANFAPARKYLHPCIYALQENCGNCGKCVRTIGALYALGKLECFKDVFDVERFYREKNDYLADILSKSNRQHYGEILVEMKRRGIEIPAEILRRERIRRSAIIAVQKHLSEN